MSVRSWFRAFFQSHGDRVTIELDPLHQRTLLLLHRFGDSGFRRIVADLRAEESITEAEAVFALVKLERDGLIERALAEAAGSSIGLYCLTAQGRKLAKLLPQGLRSRIQFTV